MVHVNLRTCKYIFFINDIEEKTCYVLYWRSPIIIETEKNYLKEQLFDTATMSSYSNDTFEQFLAAFWFNGSISASLMVVRSKTFFWIDKNLFWIKNAEPRRMIFQNDQ